MFKMKQIPPGGAGPKLVSSFTKGRTHRTSTKGLKGVTDRQLMRLVVDGHPKAEKELKRRQKYGRHMYVPTIQVKRLDSKESKSAAMGYDGEDAPLPETVKHAWKPVFGRPDHAV